MSEDALVVEVYHILLLLVPIIGGACTALLLVWKYLLAPAGEHRHETDTAIQLMRKDVADNEARIQKIESEGDASNRRIYRRLDEIMEKVSAIDARMAHFEGRLTIKE